MKFFNNNWTIYENMPAIVTVSDVDSYEMIYMNQMAKSIYNIDSDEQMRALKCYELLNQSRLKCELCDMEQIQPTEWKTTDALGPLLHEKYETSMTIIEQDDRRYRLQIALKASEDHEEEEDLSKISIAYINALTNEALHIARSEQDPERSIKRLLEYLGKALRADRTYIFEHDDLQTHNTYEWCAYGVTPEIDFLQNIPLEDGNIWNQEFDRRSYVLIRDVEATKDSSPSIYQYLKPQNITSLIVIPLYRNGRVSGFYGVDNPPAKVLEQVLPALLKTIGHFIDSMIERRDLIKELNALRAKKEN